MTSRRSSHHPSSSHDPTAPHGPGAAAASGAVNPIARRLGVLGRWPWLARMLEGAAIGGWIRNPTLRLAWVAFILTVPGMLTLWTGAFILRRVAMHPSIAARLDAVARRLAAGCEACAGVLQRALVPPQPVPAPWRSDWTWRSDRADRPDAAA